MVFAIETLQKLADRLLDEFWMLGNTDDPDESFRGLAERYDVGDSD